MTRLWVRVIRKHRIDRQLTVDCLWGEEKQALTQAVKTLDLPYPMWLDKHEKEYTAFRRTAFTPDHFVEDVEFDRLEIEFLDEGDKKRKSADPRNQFDF